MRLEVQVQHIYLNYSEHLRDSDFRAEQRQSDERWKYNGWTKQGSAVFRGCRGGDDYRRLEMDMETVAYDGKVASVKLGKRLLIPTSEIERLVSENSGHVCGGAQ